MAARLRFAIGSLPLIRPCGATFPRGGKALGQYRIILSADTASEVRQLLSQKRR